jgi:acyl carrier protein
MVRKKLLKIFRGIFPEAKLIEESTSSADIREWDSLHHVLLISEVEKAFKIRFEINDMLQMKTFGDILEKVKEKTK